MAGILVEYTRFVEVQQRRARVVAQLVQSPGDAPVETPGDSKREFCSMPGDTARQVTGYGDSRPHTGGSADV